MSRPPAPSGWGQCEEAGSLQAAGRTGHSGREWGGCRHPWQVRGVARVTQRSACGNPPGQPLRGSSLSLSPSPPPHTDVAPAFTQLPADTKVTDGMTATLRCEVSGAPRPAITWRRGRRRGVPDPPHWGLRGSEVQPVRGPSGRRGPGRPTVRGAGPLIVLSFLSLEWDGLIARGSFSNEHKRRDGSGPSPEGHGRCPGALL